MFVCVCVLHDIKIPFEMKAFTGHIRSTRASRRNKPLHWPPENKDENGPDVAPCDDNDGLL